MTVDSYTGYSSYRSPQQVDTRPVQEEQLAVLAAVDTLVAACRAKGVPCRDVLFDLSLELDEQAASASHPLDEMSADPFYWSASY